jgi:hypothetical protein
MAHLDNIEFIGEAVFDNWLINKQVRTKSNRRMSSNNRGEYNDFGAFSNPRFRQQVSQLPKINNNFNYPNYNDTEMIQWTEEWCRNVIGLGQQLDFIDRLWTHRNPSDQFYNERNALINYVTGSDELQQLAQEEDHHIQTELLQSMVNIFEHIPATTHSFVVYRVFTVPPPRDIVREGRQQYNNSRFMSCSLSKNVACGYLGGFMDEITPQSAVIKLIIPPGCKIIPVLNFGKWSSSHHDAQWLNMVPSTQFEIILPRYQIIYNVPDAIRVCEHGENCRYGSQCRYPHAIKKWCFEMNYYNNCNQISHTLCSTLERVKQRGDTDITLNNIRHYRQISFTNIQSNSPRLIKENDTFDLIRDLVPFTDDRQDIPFEDRLILPRVIPSSDIPADHYQEIPTNRQTPNVSDLYVCLPDFSPAHPRRVCLQNGWYLNYVRNTNPDNNDIHYVTIFNPRLRDYDGDIFGGRFKFILEGGGGQEDDEKGNNIYDLINEIGMDIKIPLYDKLCIIMNMKKVARKQKNEIVINL